MWAGKSGPYNQLHSPGPAPGRPPPRNLSLWGQVLGLCPRTMWQYLRPRLQLQAALAVSHHALCGFCLPAFLFLASLQKLGVYTKSQARAWPGHAPAHATVHPMPFQPVLQHPHSCLGPLGVSPLPQLDFQSSTRGQPSTRSASDISTSPQGPFPPSSAPPDSMLLQGATKCLLLKGQSRAQRTVEGICWKWRGWQAPLPGFLLRKPARGPGEVLGAHPTARSGQW